MEDLERDNGTRAKKSKYEQVRQVFVNYLLKRNYPPLSYHEIDVEDFKINSCVENEISRPNSILYSCFNNDPVAIDHTFSKFISWLRDLLKSEKNHTDLEFLVGPLFCHLYIEILRGGHSERANNFFKNHLLSVDKNKCDTLVQELINSFGNDCKDLTNLKDVFRSHKYFVKLSLESIEVLKTFLIESGHIVLLQVLQNWFTMEQCDVKENDGEEMDVDEVFRSSEEKSLCNGFTDTENTLRNSKVSLQKLLSVIEGVKQDKPNVYSVNISNVQDEVCCGLLNRKCGIVAYAYDSAVHLRSIKTLEQLNNTMCYGEVVLRGHSNRICDIAMFSECDYLLSASQDKTIRLFDLSSYEEKMVYKGHEYPVYCLATSPNSYQFVSGSYDRIAQLWIADRKHALRVFGGHMQQVTCIDYHPNGIYIATGSADKTARMWSVNNGTPIRSFVGSQGSVYVVRCSPKGTYLATAGEDRKLRIWDIATSKQLLELKTGANPVTKIAFSCDESLITVASTDGTVNVWNFETLLKVGESDVNTLNPLSSVSLTPKVLSLDYCFDTFGCFTAQHCDMSA